MAIEMKDLVHDIAAAYRARLYWRGTVEQLVMLRREEMVFAEHKFYKEHGMQLTEVLEAMQDQGEGQLVEWWLSQLQIRHTDCVMSKAQSADHFAYMAQLVGSFVKNVMEPVHEIKGGRDAD